MSRFINRFSGKEECIYLSLAFSETEHLIALTGMPSYKIQVWFWRTQDMLISEESEMITDKQKITCSSSLPLTVAQFSHSSGRLIIWEVHGTQKFCKLIKRKVQLEFEKLDGPFEDVYSIDGNVHVVNKHGDIYCVIPSSGSMNLIAKWNGAKGEYSSCIAYIRNGILVSGPEGTLKYFKRQKYVWNEIFQANSPAPFIMLKGHVNDFVIGTTIDGSLYKIILADSAEKTNIGQIKSYDPRYEFFSMIYPTGEYLLAVDEVNDIHVICVDSGERVSKICLENQKILQSHPRYPFVAVANGNGDVTFVSLFDPENPKILTEFMLSRRTITSIRFSDNGNFLVAIDNDFKYFVLKTVPGEKMTILHHFKENLNFVELIIMERRTELSLLFLRADSVEETAGSFVTRIVIQLCDNIENMVKTEFELPGLYSSILSKSGEADQFYSIHLGDRLVEVLEIEGDLISVVEEIETPHNLQHIEGFNDGNHLITWSFDGIAAAYDVDKNHELLTAFVSNNRHKYGVKMARCNAKCELMVTLDQSGNLFCSKLNIQDLSKAQLNYPMSIEKIQEKVAEMFSQTSSGGFPGLSIEHFGKKFTDLKSEQTYQMEARESEQTRKLLFSKLDELRSHVKKLLNENERLQEDEKLEIQDFNLDLETTASKESDAKQERDQQEKKMMDFIEAQTNLNDWIIEKCWKPMETKGAKLRGMFINMFVDNYPLLPEVTDSQLKSITLLRSIENSVARQDAFLPWRPIPTM